ncbi:MAG: DUF2997 domain-containing protein [Methanomassiliicoccaceae archaeon]|nr:DUF2997 domain-containing protein [Methanomassiliicoccaceae archaeon]
MPEQKITIQIDENGQISAKTDGFKGEICLDALQNILGAEEVFADVKPTDDFYVQTEVAATNKIRQGGGLK